MDNMELNVNEMEEVAGGRGGSPTELPRKKGFKVYRIEKGATMIRIAERNNCTVEYLMSINPTIKDKKDITAGYYMYVPE